MLQVHGKLLDNNTRCHHWHSPLDIIALKFKCCNQFWACYQCHQELANHPPQRFDIHSTPQENVILCGLCNTQMTFQQYSATLSCPHCHSKFNPGCKLHYHLYFINSCER
ncbi:hypothetical protein TBLA_0C00850 [Henningerozyma blattae CBS 6284]|uniref:CHY-type domain-containing protein n=1 Tax=Henningerozyma blattae (strain ATCC 34711 / CBS 6284 / DSM 70876 / NBRC 10599 / NRRL Y-10934 / UCD 77-7) TaxID=1071380 RepID=I2H0J7_HENB6|nr:hypothetical protein TBLA_0C00850 [Tetrapisispora blattae CBS 6284]CCH59899.1 hypothetical protein TBLA_0C00850 [Tetrapisispora blattae CBS 6284]